MHAARSAHATARRHRATIDSCGQRGKPLVSFDIAVGRCIEVDDTAAVVRLDGAMLRKLRPGLLFTAQPNAHLRVSLSLCSARRPPRQGQELFLDFQKTTTGAPTWLDIDGSGDYADVDVRLLATDVSPMPRPEPARKRQFY
jgi:hypothetical protein